MKRHGFAMEIKKGEYNHFRQGLGEIWPVLTAFLDRKGMKNFSIWTAEHLVFGYYETEDDFLFTEEDEREVAGWERQWSDTFTWLSKPYGEMRLMYQDYGRVRESKEMIRHRVFITRLQKGQEEEYKRRHDRLILQRGDQVTEGPDSNFTIWYAGGYIFGYDEIDTTMEVEATPKQQEETREWEIKMLEIMSWITDDVDWLTGEHHPHIQRLAWHYS